MQQYHKGDKIRIVKVGHPLWEGDKVYDMRPQDVGREAEIQGSYDDLYPNPDRVQNGPIGYSIKWLDTGTTGAWYHEYQIEPADTPIEDRITETLPHVSQSNYGKAVKDLWDEAMNRIMWGKSLPLH